MLIAGKALLLSVSRHRNVGASLCKRSGVYGLTTDRRPIDVRGLYVGEAGVTRQSSCVSTFSSTGHDWVFRCPAIVDMAVARSIEESRPKEQPKPNSSDTGEIASALWEHIEKRQNDKTDSDDMKRTIVVTGAPYDDSHNPADRRRDDTAFAKELVTKLGIDSSTIQRVFPFPQKTDRGPITTDESNIPDGGD